MSEDSGGLFQAAEKEVVKRQLEKIVSEFEELGTRLRAVHAGLPVSPREDIMLLGEEDPDFSCVVRGAIECASNDHLKNVVETLLTAAQSEAK